MPRPHKRRMIDLVPACDSFHPAGRESDAAGEVSLFWEELEALRLKDLEGLDQAQAAERMEVSRPTFQRILRSARNKVAQALINGLSIRVGGGHYEIVPRMVRCRQCGHKWQERLHHSEPAEERELPLICPECGSKNVSMRRHRRSERHSR